MESKILEASVIINGRNTMLVNTDMDIKLVWDLKVEKFDTNAQVQIECKYLFGNFFYSTEVKSTYTKQVSYKFKTDDTWKYNCVSFSELKMIEPLSAIINFDDKSVNIKF